MNENKGVGLDEVLKKLGQFGKFTVYNYLLILIPSFLTAIISPLYNFEAMDINYRCKVPECENLNYTIWLEYAIPQEKDNLSKCKVYQYVNNSTDECSIEAFNSDIIQECDSYVYSDEDSVVKDFNLGCQNWKRTLIGTVHNAGSFIALPLTGLISDRYGRVIAMSITSFMNGILGIARSFSTSYNMMIVLEFFESTLGGGMGTSSFVMAMEFITPKARPLGNALVSFIRITGFVTLSALAWWLQSWRNLLKIIFSLAFIPTLYFIILKESPRWLISKGRYEEAVDILKNAAKMNKVEISEDMLKSLHFANDTQDHNRKCGDFSNDGNIEQLAKKPSLFWQIIKSKILMVRLVICSTMWMSASFIYYGLSINSVSLAGNKYLNYIISSLVELPANIVVLFLVDRVGRKRLITFSFLLSGCLCISSSLLPKDQNTWSLILYFSGKLFSTITYSTIYIFASEIFPTNARQTLFSFCSTMGRFGTTLAPLTPLLALYYQNLPAIFFGGVAVFASFLTFTLPETINVTLPNNVTDAEKISKQI